jgi:hypothetical protein
MEIAVPSKQLKHYQSTAIKHESQLLIEIQYAQKFSEKIMKFPKL